MRLDSEEQCHGTCNFYEDILDCKFSIWAPDEPANCLLYDLEISTFLHHCDLVGAPKYTNDCNIEEPEDFSCDGFR